MLHRDEINIHLHSVLRLSIDGLRCIRSQHYLCFVFSDATFSKLIVQMWPILSLKKHQLKPKKLAKIIAKAAGRPIDHICHYLGYLKCNQYSCKDTKSPVLRKKIKFLWNTLGGIILGTNYDQNVCLYFWRLKFGMGNWVVQKHV